MIPNAKLGAFENGKSFSPLARARLHKGGDGDCVVGCRPDFRFCVDFRMPAADDVPPARWPASENLQRTKSRKGVRGGMQHALRGERAARLGNQMTLSPHRSRTRPQLSRCGMNVAKRGDLIFSAFVISNG